MKKKVLAFYREYYAEHHKTPTLRACAEALGISHMTVAHHVEMICRDGDFMRNNRRIYLAKNHKMIDARKNHSDETNRQKAEAGRAGAEALKKRALETGISRFNTGLAKDASKIEANINRIVENAEKNGTLYRPRPVFVVLVGEKVG
ncbi:MAG: hypothetical protein E6R03_15840 [Hyphomicrobiaceae bacterium]|nr:MAG: hypothetical protein E6R03_15840 [Hyphomicrobiaceae bacterium]